MATMASATALVAAVNAAAAAAASKPPSLPSDVMSGVLDYSALNGPSSVAAVAAAAVSSTKSSKFGSGNGNAGFDMGRHPISTHTNNSLSGYGGRLQFFKGKRSQQPMKNSNFYNNCLFFEDGKFILELARAKDGDKAGWVSVPRKAFRTPSAATSATVTPTSAVTTTYPKNENSTSLSCEYTSILYIHTYEINLIYDYLHTVSDDNSSIQSSPWQRDQPWKQTRPRRGISKELSLYYQRPRHNVLNSRARKAAMRKRRRPYEVSLGSEDPKSIFERIPTTPTENADETLKATDSSLIDSKSPERQQEQQSQQSDEIKDEAKLEAAIKKDVDVTDIKTESESEPKTNLDDCKDIDVDGIKTEANVEKMNTSEDEDAMSVTVDDANQSTTTTPTTTTTNSGLVNGNANELNGDSKTHISKCEAPAGDEVNTRSRSTTRTTATTEIRLKKHKPRAKLNSIIQKLIDGVPARLEQLSKTPAAPTVAAAAAMERNSSSGGGAIGSLSHSLAHKVGVGVTEYTKIILYICC